MNEYDGGNIKVFTSEEDFEFEIINANKENINLLARFNKKKKKRIQITKILNKRGEITTDTRQI